MAERFAGEGYVALAPDLYHGQVAEEPDEARKLAMALERDRAVKEIGAASRYLTDQEYVRPKKIGVIGWCMGGGLALSTAAEDRSLGAVVCFYGRPLDAQDTTRLQVPVLGLYAGHDHGISVDDVKAFQGELERNRTTSDIRIYQGADHAFFNNSRPAYNAEAAADAWDRTLKWFGKYLT